MKKRRAGGSASIRVRILLTCWTITALTLLLVVAAQLPAQKQDLFEALRSKALGVSSSLQDITAGAALSEDYSSVVDHCAQVLQGDEAIDYLVITKNDGFSVVVERNGWRTETLDGRWRPGQRVQTAEIAHVPLVGKRVFRFARPFDYSAIQWGWINVGLSVKSYDESLGRLYARTALLALLGAGLSLLISMRQARRLVKPLIGLQDVVGQVARGDLEARAWIEGGVELEGLARSFNAMADTIQDRNRVLESVRFAGQQLLSAGDWSSIIEDVLAKIGEAAGASRVSVFANRRGAADELLSSCRYEWTAPGIESMAHKWQDFPWEGSGLEDWAARLEQGQTIVADFAGGQEPLRGCLDPSTLSLVSTPIQAGGAWWGFLDLDECRRGRVWSEAEKDSLQAIAGMLGAAIARQQYQQALIEAKEGLERRVEERTVELRAEVEAKELAHERLAEAQQGLMELSRRSGMAEIATGVLHNVGNVLNSVNVSATAAADQVRESRVENLVRLARMLEEHATDLPEFLTRDPKGQRAIPYLVKLSGHLEGERQTVLKELGALTGHVGHIKQIVATQQNYAKVSGLAEEIAPDVLVEDAISIVRPAFERHRIRLERDFAETPPLLVDKHKALQILLNLLRNAKNAVNDGGNPQRRVRVRIRRPAPERVSVMVDDTGVGIPSENLTRIFAHGFTTRPDGHGFGLHSSANAAAEMGGSLHAQSDGPGLGASFTLELPLTPPEKREETRKR